MSKKHAIVLTVCACPHISVQFLYELHNLFGVLALANAFEMMGTFRLEHTKKRIPEDLLQVFSALCVTML